MGELTEGVNWLAVDLAPVLSFFWAGLWYSPWLFATKWMQGVNAKPDPDAENADAAACRAADWNIPVGLGCGHNCRA